MSTLLTSDSSKRLMKKWEAILESGTPIASKEVKENLAIVLENTYRFNKRHGLLGEAGPGMTVGTGAGTFKGMDGKGWMRGLGYPTSQAAGSNNYGDFYLPNVVMPMLRRIMPELMANELVAVQPLNGPTGYALAYRPLLTDYADGTQREVGFNPVDTRYTGLTQDLTGAVDYNYTHNYPLSGDDASGTWGRDLSAISVDTTAEAWKAYAGNDGIYAGVGHNVNGAEYNDIWGQTQLGNQQFGAPYRTVSFGLVKSLVEAKTRKLAAMWSPELAEDMQAMHGIDVEKEMVETLTYEIGAEIDRQIITEMVKAAIVGGSVTEWTPMSADGLDQMGRLATLLTQITVEANQIAIRTRRGAANFVVTTPRVCALLQQLSMNKFTSFKTSATMPTVPDSGVGALTKVGLINDDSMLLVRDAWANTNPQGSDYLLMGYKGKTAGDSGIIYCPYVPLQLSKVLQPNTFTPSIGARTRYGIMSNPWDAKNYYAFMTIKGLSTPYQWNGERQFIAKPSEITNGTAIIGA